MAQDSHYCRFLLDQATWLRPGRAGTFTGTVLSSCEHFHVARYDVRNSSDSAFSSFVGVGPS